MIIEVRTYRLLPGTADRFVGLLREESVPMLRRFGIRVLDYGISMVAEDDNEEAYLIRGFDDLDARASEEEAFYGSVEWKTGPREAIVSCISDYHTIVFEAFAEVALGLEGTRSADR